MFLRGALSISNIQPKGHVSLKEELSAFLLLLLQALLPGVVSFSASSLAVL